MKTIDQIIQESADAAMLTVNTTGLVSGKIGEYELNHLEKFAKQLSNAFQPTVPALLAKIEAELNKFAYTLGNLDNINDEDVESDDEDLVVFTKATGDLVRNMYIHIEWEKLSSGQSYAHRPDGAALKISCEVTIKRVSEEEFAAILADAENSDGDDTDQD
jgi:hypothetical protein